MTADEPCILQQPPAAGFEPRDGLRRVDARGQQPFGMFVGPLRLALAEKGVDDPVEEIRAPIALHDEASRPGIESPYRVAAVVQQFARPREIMRQRLDETAQFNKGMVDVQFHIRDSLSATAGLRRPENGRSAPEAGP